MIQKQKVNQFWVSINHKRDNFRKQIRREYIQNYKSSIRKKFYQYNNSNQYNNHQERYQQQQQQQQQQALLNTTISQKFIGQKVQQIINSEISLDLSYSTQNMMLQQFQKRDLYEQNYLNLNSILNLNYNQNHLIIYDFQSIKQMLQNKDFQSIIKHVPIYHSLQFIQQLLKQYQLQLRTNNYTNSQIEKIYIITNLLNLLINKNLLSKENAYLQTFSQIENLQNDPLIEKANQILSKIIQIIYFDNYQDQSFEIISEWIIPLAQKQQFYQIWMHLSLTSSKKIKQKVFDSFTSFFHKNIIYKRFAKRINKFNHYEIKLLIRQNKYLSQFQYIVNTINNFITIPPKQKLFQSLQLIYILFQIIKIFQMENQDLDSFLLYQQKNQRNKLVFKKTIQKNIQIKFQIINQCLNILLLFLQTNIIKGVKFLQQNQDVFLTKILQFIKIFIKHFRKIEHQLFKIALKRFYTLIICLFGVSNQISKQVLEKSPQLFQSILKHLSLINSINKTSENTYNIDFILNIIFNSLDAIIISIRNQISLKFLKDLSCIIFDVYIKNSEKCIKAEISKIFNFIIRCLNLTDFIKKLKYNYVKVSQQQKNQAYLNIKLIYQKVLIIACKQISQRNYQIDILTSGIYKMTGCLITLINNTVPQKIQLCITFENILQQYKIENIFYGLHTQNYDRKINALIKQKIQIIQNYIYLLKQKFQNKCLY